MTLSALIPSRLLSVLALAALLGGCAAGRPDATRALTPGDDQRLADAALSGGTPDMAIDLYKKVLQRNPDTPDALAGLGDALLQRNEPQQARLIYLRLAELRPQEPRAALGLARIALQQQQWDEALARYRSVLVRDPDQPAANAGIGVVYDLQQRHALAQDAYRRALAHNPDDLALRNNLGLSLILSHQVRAGIDELLKIADVPSAPPQARQNLALGYGLLGNDVAAERILQADLPQDQVQNNLRYYRALRARLQPGNGAIGRRHRRK